MADWIMAIFGFLFALYLPGFFITMLFFRESKRLEKIVLSITFSIMIAMAIGIILGYNENVKNITGGINSYNVWKLELGVTALLLLATLIVYHKNLTPSGMKALYGRYKKELEEFWNEGKEK